MSQPEITIGMQTTVRVKWTGYKPATVTVRADAKPVLEIRGKKRVWMVSVTVVTVIGMNALARGKPVTEGMSAMVRASNFAK
jgi:hypothetical protein